MDSKAILSKPVDKWIPWFFVMFFGVIFAVNAVFVTVALKTQTGMVTQHPYEEGITYNRTLDEAAREKALGWRADIELRGGNTISLTLHDKDNAPIKHADIVAKAVRPVQDGYDFELALTDQGNGVYSAPADFPLPGQWDIRIYAKWKGTSYQHSKMLIVP